MAGLNTPQFMKTFKQVAGLTLVAYLNHVRLANAARLLSETNRSIADIANVTKPTHDPVYGRAGPLIAMW